MLRCCRDLRVTQHLFSELSRMRLCIRIRSDCFVRALRERPQVCARVQQPTHIFYSRRSAHVHLRNITCITNLLAQSFSRSIKINRAGLLADIFTLKHDFSIIGARRCARNSERKIDDERAADENKVVHVSIEKSREGDFQSAVCNFRN